MFSRNVVVPVFALGLALGFLSFGCMTELHRPAAAPNAATPAPPAVPEPVPAPPPSWAPAASSAPAPAGPKVQQVAAQVADEPPLRTIATSDSAPKTASQAAGAPVANA